MAALEQRVSSMDSKGMQFAKQQLEKFGWTEGSGLGRKNDGITAALRPKLKFDASGLGHKQGEELVNEWWNLAFNKAAKSFNVVTTDEGASVVKTGELGSFRGSHKLPTNYGDFKLAGTLTNEGVLEEAEHPDPTPVKEVSHFVKLSDEELFRMCGGRTAHKGARHGHRCRGKLDRVARQEAELLARLGIQTAQPTGGAVAEEGKKRKKTQRQEAAPTGLVAAEQTTELEQPKKKEKKKKNKKELENADLSEPVVSVQELTEPPVNVEKKKRKKVPSAAEITTEPVEIPLVDPVPQKKKKINLLEAEILTESVKVELSEEPEKKKKKKKKGTASDSTEMAPVHQEPVEETQTELAVNNEDPLGSGLRKKKRKKTNHCDAIDL